MIHDDRSERIIAEVIRMLRDFGILAIACAIGAITGHILGLWS